MEKGPVSERILLSKICKSYKDHVIFDRFSCCFQKGEMAAVTGASGKGKSTLLSLIGLLDLDFSGQYSLFGQDVSSMTPSRKDRLRNSSIGFVFQNNHLIPHMSVLDNLLLPFFYQKKPVSYQEAKARCISLAGRFFIDSLLDRPVDHLSGGEKQRIAIARAMTQNPVLLLADEPTGNLDPENTAVILDCFQSLKEQGKTILMVTHDGSLLHRFDRVIRL